MFVITADQVDSAHRADLAELTMEGLQLRYGSRLRLAFERTAGDEIQGLTDDPAAALDVILELTRAGEWSVGCGIGGVREPLPESVRSASGRAFVLARGAVTAAKRRRHRFALFQDGRDDVDAGPLIELLLALRVRRSLEGWQVYDLLQARLTQAEAAARLGISAQAVSQRVFAAALRTEEDARPALIALLAAADG